MLTLQAAVTPKTSVCSRRNVGQRGQGEWLGRGLPASLLQHCLSGQLSLCKSHHHPPAPLSGCSAAPCQGAAPA